MPHVLIVDDDRFVRKVVETNLAALSHRVTSACDGLEGLKALHADPPDIIVTDKMMPNMNGFEFTQQVRAMPQFSHIPILVLTSNSELKDKLDAFKAGADDYLSKPFEAAELAARIDALMRRAEAASQAQNDSPAAVSEAKTIAVHSLRGGVGCSSLAVNLAYCMAHLWQKQVMLYDMVLASGQLTLMLNKPLRRSWADLSSKEGDSYDFDMLENVITKYDPYLQFVAAPASPTDAELVHVSTIATAHEQFASRYDYIVADLPHDFSDISLQMLDNAESILLMLAPEMASIKSASIALDTYSQLGYGADKVKIVLNRTVEHNPLSRKQIESALRRPISMEIPHAPRSFIEAINRGEPISLNIKDPTTAFFEQFALQMSSAHDKENKPNPMTPMWQRLAKRHRATRPLQTKSRKLLSFG